MWISFGFFENFFLTFFALYCRLNFCLYSGFIWTLICARAIDFQPRTWDLTNDKTSFCRDNVDSCRIFVTNLFPKRSHRHHQRRSRAHPKYKQLLLWESSVQIFQLRIQLNRLFLHRSIATFDENIDHHLCCGHDTKVAIIYGP